jgi:hypothetical protein
MNIMGEEKFVTINKTEFEYELKDIGLYKYMLDLIRF